MTIKDKKYFLNKFKRINQDFINDLHKIISDYEYEEKMSLLKFKIKLMNL